MLAEITTRFAKRWLAGLLWLDLKIINRGVKVIA
jgi:hypothetical protein